ncbi:MAG: GspE/PulE family protein [Flavobacteriaceae bacterium]|nr:GspE/PulE family protein [Flavobacteriaceae bacterium]
METVEYKLPLHLQQLISAEQAYHYRIVPVEINPDSFKFITDCGNRDELSAELGIVMGKQVELTVDSSEKIQKYLSTNYRISQDVQFRYTPDFLDKILLTSKEIGSSDIHFEPYEKRCRIRYRLDGKLVEQYQIPIEEYPVIANKIKIRAGLDIAEKRLPQDGRITVKNETEEFDIRVSSLPTLFGEKIVLRILSKDSTFISLEQLGFTSSEQKTFTSRIRKPQGIVLISGPTGSGKTTTLYAALKLLNDHKTNIVTIEDPIEYTLEGVNQVQLKENIGLDFAASLRTFLRQDPDIIMVGEIRDVATANMAIRASLTGHLVLSTIHTNSAWATVSRLIDMGIPPFLIASTLTLSVAQRLIRKLCVHCKREVKFQKELFPELKFSNGLMSHFEAVGCEECFHTGYSGRKAIYELLPITKDIAVHIKNNDLQIDDYYKNHGIKTLRDNGMRLVVEGETSIEEAYSLLTD